MRDFKGYETVKIASDIKQDKFKKAIRIGKITLKGDELKGNVALLVHPSQALLIKKAQAKGRGITSMPIAASDVLFDLEMNGAKSVWSWLDDYKKRKGYTWIYDDNE